MKGSWEVARQDCLKAIEVDPKNVKGYYFLAKADVERKDYNVAIRHFTKALDFCTVLPIIPLDAASPMLHHGPFPARAPLLHPPPPL